ncbi:hypothetical protein B0T10DRAFT_523526 [Thelonectria olida]|uniref:Uncharacterized protein n=1 Tax=Thelonectria olida TaxID=1576542 RepID=A0A9P8VQL7_9HYPO|nr:hypothetical protein B0T10DRAFT_523526 [Thelonectria olida]
MEMVSLTPYASPSRPALLDGGQSTLRTLLRDIYQQLKETPRAIWNDLRATGWRGAGFILIGLCWTLGLITAIGFLTIQSSWSYTNYVDPCGLGGEFSPFADSYNWWAPRGFFQITLRTPEVSFAAAKAIDITWDVVIGRGGQAVLAWVSWRVFADSVTVSIATKPATYTSFFLVFLQKEPSLVSVYRISRDFIFVRGLCSTIATYFMVATMAFILGFPTFASSMTGYTTADKAYLELRDGKMYQLSNATPVAYLIRDGDRINKTVNLMLGITVHADVSKYGFFGNAKKETEWNGTIIPSPALDVEAYNLPPGGDQLFGYNWSDHTGQYPFRNKENATYYISGEIYTINYIMKNASCQPIRKVRIDIQGALPRMKALTEWTLKKFQWGFSFIQVTLMAIFLVIWTAGIYVMWLKAHLTLRLNGHPGTAQGWKCLLQLAEVMEKQLKGAGIDSKALSDPELKDQIRKLLESGSVSSAIEFSKGNYSFRRGFCCWLKRERWWVLSLFVFIGLLTAIPFITNTWLGFLIMPVGILFSISFGRAAKSMMFLLLCFLILYLVVVVPLFSSWGTTTTK